MKLVFIIGFGSFIGGTGRYLSQLWVHKYLPVIFPYGTLAVNISGCFLIGVIYALSEKGNLLSPEWRMFLATGICGGFTTFSAFAYENLMLMRDGEFFYALLYTGLSVLLGMLAAYAGIFVIKLF
ncbi:MAG: fluoride efflux transporter CrcB [Saprospiraceae bacterium]|nr:MAG: fluoride efflux transporter CrcB [Saprospiraceae bacterium]